MQLNDQRYVFSFCTERQKAPAEIYLKEVLWFKTFKKNKVYEHLFTVAHNVTFMVL